MDAKQFILALLEKGMAEATHIDEQAAMLASATKKGSAEAPPEFTRSPVRPSVRRE
jgi:hypothetical protein